ncbi:unnamed protein product [Linum tenue]|uniref:Senescence regulator n=1 Tax=Linum tenue TaxID=586396 RepID=A0AAV0PML2_9ROSI|nr:unnamed protein product [Linum tenue]
MAARSGKLFRSNIFAGSEVEIDPESVFEFEESDVVWSSSGDGGANHYRSRSKGGGNKRLPAAAAAAGLRSAAVPTSASLPLNIPDWSKIYKEESYGGRRRRRAAEVDISMSELGDHLEEEEEEDSDDYEEEEEEWASGGGAERLPPHEYLARRRGASLSVHEGAGRTLKGRDLRQVRNAVWKKVGFED